MPTVRAIVIQLDGMRETTDWFDQADSRRIDAMLAIARRMEHSFTVYWENHPTDEPAS